MVRLTVWAFALLAVAGLLPGCTAQSRQTCATFGYPDGSPEHTACVERASERSRQSLDSNQSRQQQLINQQNRRRTCYSSRLGYGMTTACH